MRKKDDRRKIHREEVKQRKQAERSKKDEELKRLKTLKKKEIMEKIQKLQHITGNQDIAFKVRRLLLTKCFKDVLILNRKLFFLE